MAYRTDDSYLRSGESTVLRHGAAWWQRLRSASQGAVSLGAGLVCMTVGLLSLSLLLGSFNLIILDSSWPLAMTASLFVVLMGVAVTVKGTWQAAVGDTAGAQLGELYRRQRLTKRRFNVVVIGGGTGLAALLRGIKAYPYTITAIVTVSDDGGSSGLLREQLGMIPPGDIRNCLCALSDEEQLLTELFQYRFDEGEGLKGHSFGNLFLTALTAVTGNLEQALRESSRVLNIRGRVLPASLSDITLIAECADGQIISGESSITRCSASPIKRLSCKPAAPEPLPEALQAIREADVIILGPGSLYTSVIANLLIPGIAQAIRTSGATTIYICNVMTQPGESDGFSAADHVQAIFDHAGDRLVDWIVVNDHPPTRLLDAYTQEGAQPVDIDEERLRRLGVRVIAADLLDENSHVRHNSQGLATILFDQIITLHPVS